MIKSFLTVSMFYFLFNMSTTYYFVPDTQTNCKDEIPATFTSFLESEDAYGETSEYFKVCKKINKDLNIFSERAVGFDNKNQESWIDIRILKDSLESYRRSLENQSIDSFDLKYDPRKNIRDSLFDLMMSSHRNKKIEEEYNALDSSILNDDKHPYYFLPADRKYISGKKLNEDISDMIKTLNCYSDNGVKKIKIVYE